MQRFGIVGVLAENLAVDLMGLGKLTRALAGDRDLHCLGNVRWRHGCSRSESLQHSIYTGTAAPSQMPKEQDIHKSRGRVSEVRLRGIARERARIPMEIQCFRKMQIILRGSHFMPQIFG